MIYNCSTTNPSTVLELNDFNAIDKNQYVIISILLDFIAFFPGISVYFFLITSLFQLCPANLFILESWFMYVIRVIIDLCIKNYLHSSQYIYINVLSNTVGDLPYRLMLFYYNIGIMCHCPVMVVIVDHPLILTVCIPLQNY